jgi:hypothetical protein
MTRSCCCRLTAQPCNSEKNNVPISGNKTVLIVEKLPHKIYASQGFRAKHDDVGKDREHSLEFMMV